MIIGLIIWPHVDLSRPIPNFMTSLLPRLRVVRVLNGYLNIVTGFPITMASCLHMQTSLRIIFLSIPRQAISLVFLTGRWQDFGPSGGSIEKRCLVPDANYGG